MIISKNIKAYEVLRDFYFRSEFSRKEVKTCLDLRGLSFGIIAPYLEVVRTETYEVKGKTTEPKEVIEFVTSTGAVMCQVDADYYYINKLDFRALSDKYLVKTRIVPGQPVQGKRYYYKVKPDGLARLSGRIESVIEKEIATIQRTIRENEKRLACLQDYNTEFKRIKK